ncbi:uncharacterized protein LOC113850734 [Abrus precatorius]|uniref:Uncharacterized protein LOC113850734 n=1 Tax=Abrus precatorius TaxID=3816 RepID=A0A8B8K0C1_ABRPR|nr:uncharacterized protein LOC113850734 [Abrus precatorius]
MEYLMVGPEMLQETKEKVELIREKLRATQSRQKSYADRRRRSLEFEVGDHVFLRVSRTTGVGRALRAKKLTPKFIGQKYVPDSSHIIEPDVVELRDNLSVEVPAAHIEDTRVKELRGQSIQLVKVVWDPVTGDATWELEERMRVVPLSFL